MAAIAGHDNGLLAEIAAFRVADRLPGAADFHDETLFIHVRAVHGPASLDAEHVVRLTSRRRCAGGTQGAPDPVRRRERTVDVVTGQTEHAVLAQDERHFGLRSLTLPARLELRQARNSNGQSFAKDGAGLRTRQMELGIVMRRVEQLHLLADQVAIQVFDDRFAHARSRVDPQAGFLL